MRTATVAEITGAVEDLAKREPGGAVAFDGDGTLWSGDIGEDYFAALIARAAFTDVAREALAREAAEHGLGGLERADGAHIAQRIHEAYVAGTFPEERVCEIMAWAVAGERAADVDAFAAETLARLDLEARLHAETVAALRWMSAHGVDAFLVSASPRAIVEQAAKKVGVPLARVVSAIEARDASGTVLPSVVRPIPYGPGKVKNLRDKLGERRVLYAAFGDNAFDVPMLREARVPVAIRPKPRLVERALEVPGLAVLERL